MLFDQFRPRLLFRKENNITKASAGIHDVVFPKRLAHEIVSYIVYFLTKRITSNKKSPWESMLEYADLAELLSLESDDSELRDKKFVPYDVRYHGDEGSSE